jgi:hypothetical protein
LNLDPAAHVVARLVLRVGGVAAVVGVVTAVDDRARRDAVRPLLPGRPLELRVDGSGVILHQRILDQCEEVVWSGDFAAQ